MIEVIPSINVRTFEEVLERIKKVEPYVKWCHLDVTDGLFSKHLTWHDPRDLLNLETKLDVEAHLMVLEPEKIVDQWLVKPIKRVIVHLEAASDTDLIIKKCRAAGIEIGLAINPDTFLGKLQSWCGKVDLFQILAVKPGPSGQKMDEESFDKIVHLRRVCPGSKIEIDGGINQETAQKAVESGTDILVAGAYIFSSSDIQQAIQELID